MNKPKKAVAVLHSLNENNEGQELALDSQFEILMQYVKKANIQIVEVVDNQRSNEGDEMKSSTENFVDAFNSSMFLESVDYFLLTESAIQGIDQQFYREVKENLSKYKIEIKVVTLSDFVSFYENEKHKESLSLK